MPNHAIKIPINMPSLVFSQPPNSNAEDMTKNVLNSRQTAGDNNDRGIVHDNTLNDQ